MRVLRTKAQVVPAPLLATFLNSPCTSLRIAQEKTHSTVYLVVGKSNGETVFLPTDRSEFVSKFESEVKVPVSAMAAGDLRNVGRNELVCISANGNLYSLSFPSGNPPSPNKTFCQLINANVCSAEILDIDGDGLMEMIVVMTDRVVRSYRYVEETGRIAPLNKWEMPAQVSGWSIGRGESASYALLSQSDESHYIRLDFGQTKDIRVFQSAQNAKDKTAQLRQQLVLAPDPSFVTLIHCLVEKVLVVDTECDRVTELVVSPGTSSCIACVTTTTLRCGIRVLITVDPWGGLAIFGWTNATDISVEPLARCSVMRDVDQMCSFPGPGGYQLMVGTVNVFNKVAVFSIDLGYIVTVV